MKKWIIKKPDTAVSKKLAAECAVTPLCADVLAARGISTSTEAAEQFNADRLSDPFLLKDMKEAAELINDAIENFTPVCIFGDYDCDGIASTSMLFSYLECMGANVMYILPERDEGYGLNENAVRRMHEQGAQLIITVDNGISAHKEAELIYSLGMKLIITDHHQPGETLPRAEAIVDPHRKDCVSPFKYLCGAGVVLKLIAAAEGGSYDTALNEYGELAALATVADVVSLTGENRFIVKYGLKLMENSERAGINALISKSGIKFPISSTSVAFGLAPRINASGRFGSPLTAARLLLTDDDEEAMLLADELERLNTQRKEEEGKIIDDIEKTVAEKPEITVERVLVLSGENWHHGIIGIVASRMVERFDKPCFIITIEGETARGSARSFGAFSAFKALEYCSDLLIKFGGHPGAGGFSIETAKIPEFSQRLQKFAQESFEYMPIPDITADKLISPSEITVENVNGLKVLEPFGEGSRQPVFALGGAEVADIIPLSQGVHTKLRLNCQGRQLDALVFRISPDEMFIKKGDKIDILFTMETKSYAGRESISIIIKDFRKCGLEQNKYFAAKDAYEKYRRNEPLPAAYYQRICPERNELVPVYKKIASGNYSTDTLYMSFMTELNYCKMMMCVDIFNELGLVSRNSFSQEIRAVKGAPKADLETSVILKDLRNKSNKGVTA